MISAVIEAILFASAEPVTADKLAQAAEVTKNDILIVIDEIEQRYNAPESGLTLLRLANAYQIATKQEYAPQIKAAIDIKRQTPLSGAAMETLAIIAYNQPISKAFIEQVRGIDSSSVVNTLTERGLVEEAGRLDLPGKPVAYRTTENFLRCFGISALHELPPLPGEEEQLSFDAVIEESP
ncbi:MAG: SMC-Scp complex subunit ScpB [Oscillospiraceae bacterium]|nr:SMC-Scp complex subunit ScpB [Oscillospiraceae bacterium]